MNPLQPDEVIRLNQDNVEINKVLAQYFTQKLFHPKDIILALARDSNFAELLMRGIVFEVMHIDKAGWQKGTLKLELNFYPDADNKSVSPLDKLS
ncbi:hypothetical protein L3556_09620 [Candidatus Synechococcus calcipolaris G9]|uniref:KGK domain-containing protein n=1 Tax=Candidatus Synechococcus calcipolaris G9 TaxID=1497997 RepID=A0ABT6F033_9SYNE|nr:KGK domain-containing protein [Candidatus Synechococcus calcipolaris]MDG2991184.1 hypothetical protein [Candidatus Synechococcus calcipolaris G9]